MTCGSQGKSASSYLTFITVFTWASFNQKRWRWLKCWILFQASASARVVAANGRRRSRLRRHRGRKPRPGATETSRRTSPSHPSRGSRRRRRPLLQRRQQQRRRRHGLFRHRQRQLLPAKADWSTASSAPRRASSTPIQTTARSTSGEA